MVANFFGSFLKSVAVSAALATLSAQAAAVDFETTLGWSGVHEIRAGVSGVVVVHGLVPGARVAAGGDLVSISAAYYGASLAAATRGAELARGELDLAEQAFERNEILFEDGSMSLVEFDVAKIELARARARAAAAEAALVSAQSQAARSRLRAPHDVVVLDMAVAEGDFVEAGLAPPVLLTIARSDALEAAVEVEPAVRSGLALGDDVRVRVADREMTGAVTWIRGAVTAGTPSHRVGVSITGDIAGLVAGMPVVVEIP